MKTLSLCLLAVAGVLVGCASAPPAQTEFPPGARAPTAAEIVSLLRGKSFTVANPNGSSTRVDHAADDSGGLTAYFAGRTDSGTWRAEDGRICFQFQVLPSNCNEVRLLGSELYMKRSNGDVVRVTPAG